MASGDILRLGGGTDFLEFERKDISATKSFIATAETPDFPETDIMEVIGKGIILYNNLVHGSVNSPSSGATMGVYLYVDGKLLNSVTSYMSGASLPSKASLDECFIPFNQSFKVTFKVGKGGTRAYDGYATVKYLI